MQRLFVVGTAHVADPRLLRALEAALDELRPDQLILEMPDGVAINGDVADQKPEMACAWRWATARGLPVRGHEPDGPSILRDGLSPERVAELLENMEALILDMAPRRIIDIFCGRRSAEGTTEKHLSAIVGELVDPDKAIVRTKAMVAAIRRLAAPEGSIVILCGGAHVTEVADAVPGCRIIHGEHFF